VRTLIIAAALGAACAGALRAQDGAVPNMLSSQEQAEGFRLLFDGTSTRGWRGWRRATMPEQWQVVDGALTLAARGGGDIVAVDPYGDFELRLEWKIDPRGNSGVFFHADEAYERIYTSAPEMQVLDDAGHPDGQNALTSAGANFGLHAAPRGVVRPAGQWNEARLIVRGAHVEHWLNGQKVVEYEMWSDGWRRLVQASKFAQWPEYGSARRGYIGLQDHGDRVAFRSIRIRELR